jgi:hypothetical protein
MLHEQEDGLVLLESLLELRIRDTERAEQGVGERNARSIARLLDLEVTRAALDPSDRHPQMDRWPEPVTLDEILPIDPHADGQRAEHGEQRVDARRVVRIPRAVADEDDGFGIARGDPVRGLVDWASGR